MLVCVYARTAGCRWIFSEYTPICPLYCPGINCPELDKVWEPFPAQHVTVMHMAGDDDKSLKSELNVQHRATFSCSWQLSLSKRTVKGRKHTPHRVFFFFFCVCVGWTWEANRLWERGDYNIPCFMHPAPGQLFVRFYSVCDARPTRLSAGTRAMTGALAPQHKPKRKRLGRLSWTKELCSDEAYFYSGKFGIPRHIQQ